MSTEKQKSKKNLSRRDFIKAAGIAAIGVSTGGCTNVAKPNIKTPRIKRAGPATSKKAGTGSNNFDVVVIGTGMGGSAAGAISALNGLKTLILEKNPRPGGSCSYYEKQGFHVDTGAHMFIRGNKGPFGNLTRRLGMGTPIEFIKAPNTLEARGINMNFVLSRNIVFRAMTAPVIAWQTQVNPLHYPSIVRLFAKIALMNESEIEKLDHVSIDEFMACHTRNAEIRSMIAGLLGLMLIVPPSEASAGESIWNLQKLMFENSLGYPRGGSVKISRTFLEGAENYGAEIRMNEGVKKILVKDGRVDSIVLDNGEKVFTRAVISTTSVKDSILRLVGKEYFSTPYIEKVNSIVPSYTAVQAKLALKKKIVKAGCLVGGLPTKCSGSVIGEFTQVAFRNASKGIQGNYIPIYAPVPSYFDPNLAPPGCQIITAVALAPTLDVELKDNHQSWVDGMMRTLNAMIPDLKENLIFCDTWTIKTLAAWTGKSDGSAISTGQTVDQVRLKRHPHQTEIKGLYLAGDCAGPARGVGTELACQSGIDCADLVSNDFVNKFI